MDKKPLSKEELAARLKEIAADETPRIQTMGAMCYSPSAPPERHTKCNMCGKDICYYDRNDHDTIMDLVSNMKELGYDVKVEVACEKCAERIKRELYPDMPSKDDEDFDHEKGIWLLEINHIFYFKAPSDTEYHRAIANYIESYRLLLALMLNNRSYNDSYDGTHFITEEIEGLEFMTGIKFGI